MESFERPSEKTPEKLERVAEIELEQLLDDPENDFLQQIKTHRDYIDNAESAQDALRYAKDMAYRRLEKSTTFQSINTHDGLNLEDVDVQGLRDRVLETLKNQVEIGRGGDAFVIIDKNEVPQLPPEVCYKFALQEKTPRGRNALQEEAEIQGRFYDTAAELADSKLGVPVPFYSLEVGSHRLIAMEKLPASSIDDILGGKGSLPQNFDVDVFCEELKKLLNHLHKNGLYHRDMHIGNIMITQKPVLEEGDRWGYLIDFGLSGISYIEETAYVKERANETFTYSNDYGIIPFIKSSLKEYQVRSRS